MSVPLRALFAALLLFNTAFFSFGEEPVASPPMKIGVNLWNLGWGNTWKDYTRPNLVPPISWYSVTDPWLPQFLQDLAPFHGPIRFMDWDFINENPIQHWADRLPKTANFINNRNYPVAPEFQKYFDGRTKMNLRIMPYEWMIDLCNRTGKDMWICVPAFSDQDYWTQLATLIRDNLDPKLKVYVEYANETWNNGFKVHQYTVDQGVAANLPGYNSEYKGGAFSVWQSLKIFKVFEDVFGVAHTGLDQRLVRVLSAGGNGNIAELAVKNVIFDASCTDYRTPVYNKTLNPFQQRPDLFAFAPYVGGNVDGASPTALAEFHDSIDEIANTMVRNYSVAFRKFGFPLGAYEGGMGLARNGDKFSANPAVYDEYLRMLDKWSDAGFVVFCQYTLYGVHTAGDAWGAKDSVTSSLAESPRYRALADWKPVGTVPSGSKP